MTTILKENEKIYCDYDGLYYEGTLNERRDIYYVHNRTIKTLTPGMCRACELLQTKTRVSVIAVIDKV